MANRTPVHNNRPLFFFLICLLCLAAAFFALRGRIPRSPVLLSQAHSPGDVQWHDGVWYWLENAGKPGSRLVRVAGSGSAPVAVADRIGSYAVGEGKAAWSARDGNRWSITLASADGTGKQTLWTGDREPRGLCLAEGRVFWLDEIPPVVPDSDPLPPLGKAIHLVSLPVAGGTPTVVASLMEPKAGKVLGVHDGLAYASATRPGPPICTILYRIPLTGGIPYVIAGEVDTQQALLTGDGTLYWTANSHEALNNGLVVCIRRARLNRAPETLGDWLPALGRLYETKRGVCYVDGGVQPAVWPVPEVRKLPEAYPLPENYSALAAGDGEMLLQSSTVLTPDGPVYRMDLP